MLFLAVFSTSCGDKRTTLNDFCKAHAYKKDENAKDINYDSCLKRLAICTEEELYDRGTTPPCFHAQSNCKKACNDFVDEVNKKYYP